MSTFLEICNQVNTIIGLQGVISSVESPLGIQKSIVEAVRSEWIDIQNLREDWMFMEGSITSFSTTQGKTNYTPAEVFGGVVQAELLGAYKSRRCVFLDNVMLRYVEYEDLPFVDNTVEQRPKWYTFEPASNTLILQNPNGIHNLDIRYRKALQVLTENGDVPSVPPMYHQAITYKAVAKVCAFIGNAGLYQEYNVKGNQALGQLMRAYIRARTIYPRGFV